MAHGMQQVQSLSQQQVLAPQLQQSLQILQAPMLELRNLIQQEIQTNPVVEEEITEPSIEDRQQEDKEFQEEFERLAKLDEEWRDYMAQSSSYSAKSQEDEERRQFFFDSIVSNETLQQHLLEQVHSGDLDGLGPQGGRADHRQHRRRRLPPDLPGGDGAEYRHRSRADSAACSRPSRLFTPSAWARGICGIACLIQLHRIGKEGTLEYKIVERHLEDLGKRRFPEIARRLGTTVEQVQRCANFIATLDPKPGQIFTPDPNNYVLPDVNVEPIDGDYQITLNGDQIPHLRISNTYKDLMSQERSGAEVKDYIRDKIRSGKFLIKSIHQRQQTISNIAHEIVRRQKDFLEVGSSALRPMTMVQIAEAVGVHETTVSRAISGKYISTPQGVFEMKYFFTPGYQTAEGASMSNTSVKESIGAAGEGREPAQPALRQGDRGNPEQARHPDRPPHGGEIPHRARHPAEQHAEDLLRGRHAPPSSEVHVWLVSVTENASSCISTGRETGRESPGTFS